jgi:SSS family solute:Na+ symporter
MQLSVFIILTIAMALATIWQVRRMTRRAGPAGDGNREVFLAGGGLSWPFIAGSITLTNLSTDQLVGMNGQQMLLLAWWELSAVVGLAILAKVFLPLYYREGCTTTNELLQKRYNSPAMRALVSCLFLAGNLLIYLPITLYTGALFLRTVSGADLPLLPLAAVLGVVGSLYAILGGLRAVAVYDTIAGVGVLASALAIVVLAMRAIGWDFGGIPAERLTMAGGPGSPIPWPTLFTGMIFIQMFYWSTNQNITQRAMAAPSLREGQKGVFAAMAIRLAIVPAIVVLPGVASYKLFGPLGDGAYGRVVAAVMPDWASGAFAAFMAAAVLTHYTSILNSSTTLWVCDVHEAYINPRPDVRRLNRWISLGFVALSIALVPLYAGTASIINLVQQLNGLLSMPILSAFVCGLVFRGVKAGAVMGALLFGVGLYAVFTWVWSPAHYIHLMLVTLLACVGVALALNQMMGGQASLRLREAPANGMKA